MLNKTNCFTLPSSIKRITTDRWKVISFIKCAKYIFTCLLIFLWFNLRMKFHFPLIRENWIVIACWKALIVVFLTSVIWKLPLLSHNYWTVSSFCNKWLEETKCLINIDILTLVITSMVEMIVFENIEKGKNNLSYLKIFSKLG